MEGRYNLRSPAVKRLMREAQELAEPTEQYYAQPLEDNLFEWHFTIRGPVDSDFNGGLYHGRIILPPDYPMKPPSIIFLTPNGRFDCFAKICLSISKHHPESWQPSWSIRTALLAIIGFMPSPGHGAIGSVDYTPAERGKLAKKSNSFVCDVCGPISEKVLPLTSKSDETKEEIMNLAAQLSMTGEKAKSAKDNPKETTADSTASAPNQPAEPTAPPVSSAELPAMELTQRTVPSDGNVATPRVEQLNNPVTLPRVQPVLERRALAETRGSRSCFDSVSYWALVLIGILFGALILRRLAKLKYLFGDEDL